MGCPYPSPDNRKPTTQNRAHMPSHTRTPVPFTLVIFGASGDLTKRKLIPAIYSLYTEGLLPEMFSVLGYARSEMSDDDFRDEMCQAIGEFWRGGTVDAGTWSSFASKLHYHTANGYDELAAHRSLRERLEVMARQHGVPGNCVFYLATQPMLFAPIIETLHEAGLSRKGASGRPWSRVIIEKPFGRDLQTSRSLRDRITTAFAEDQIFRIDHYLGKETVQNLLVFRFANSIFEPIWNQKYIDHVQITVSETVGVEARGKYYDEAGALRDMLQNHLMQLLSLVAMEPPGNLSAHAVRDEKLKVLQALRPIPADCIDRDVVLGQYTAARALPGYRQEPDVAPDSTTETYVAMKAHLDNWRWSGVPFYLRTGKRLPTRITEIDIHFKPSPRILFNAPPAEPLRPNVLSLRIQPNEGIALQFEVKRPGPAMNIQPLMMDFDYASAFSQDPPEAYERLILDAALGDSTLFTRGDEVDAAWTHVSPIIDRAENDCESPLATYTAGTWGPKEADDLIEADGRRWELMRRCIAHAHVIK